MDRFGIQMREVARILFIVRMSLAISHPHAVSSRCCSCLQKWELHDSSGFPVSKREQGYSGSLKRCSNVRLSVMSCSSLNLFPDRGSSS
jgi:hypothetical protein